MRDIGIFPTDVFTSTVPRLASSREKTLQKVQAWMENNDIPFQALPDSWPVNFDIFPEDQALLISLVDKHSTVDLINLFDLPSSESRMFRSLPSLSKRVDKSGLIDLTGLNADPWGIHIDEYALHYHQFLRRNFSANIHYGLIDAILRNSKEHGLITRIAIDEHRLRFESEYSTFIEMDRWFGPPLGPHVLDDRYRVGETFHGDPDRGMSPLHPYAGLSVRWTYDDDLKTVEIEEFMPKPKEGATWVFSRYLHAIRDIRQGVFVHCDGSVKAYRASSYPQTQADFSHRGKGEHYRKLFRIDGSFPADTWSELSTLWFRGNKLILEYFGSLNN